MICPHDKNQKATCRDCGGSALCQKHKKRSCKMCDPNGPLFDTSSSSHRNSSTIGNNDTTSFYKDECEDK